MKQKHSADHLRKWENVQLNNWIFKTTLSLLPKTENYSCLERVLPDKCEANKRKCLFNGGAAAVYYNERQNYLCTNEPLLGTCQQLKQGLVFVSLR